MANYGHGDAGIKRHQRIGIARLERGGQTAEIGFVVMSIHRIGKITAIYPPTADLGAPAFRPLSNDLLPVLLENGKSLARARVTPCAAFKSALPLEARDGHGIYIGRAAGQVDQQLDTPGVKDIVQIGDEVAPRALAGFDANELVVGAIGGNIVARILSDGNKKVRCANCFELLGKPFDIERIYPAIPRFGGQLHAAVGTGLGSKPMAEYAPTAVGKPLCFI